MEKEVQRSSKSTGASTGEDNLNLFVFQKLQEGERPSTISKKYNIKKSTLQYHLHSLIVQGLINKIGYGVWETSSNSTEKEVQKSTAVANINGKKVELLKQDSARGHAFQITFQLPKDLLNWNKREEIFEKIGYNFKKLKVPSNSQAIVFKGRKIHLTNKSIIIYEKESFIEETARESQSKAIEHFLRLIKQLERDLPANFSFGGRYRFRVTRQHYSLIKNALAKQYNDEGKKLEIYNDKGLWFLIDNSFNLNEAETIHSKTAVQDNEKVQDFFNGLKKLEGYTPQFVTNSIGVLAENWNAYGMHIKSHITAIQKLGVGIEIQNKIFAELIQAIKEMKR